MTSSQYPHANKVEVVEWNKTTPLTQEEAEARLHQEGYESFCWYDVPGAIYRKHQHDYDECLWILKGALEIVIVDQNHTVKTGARIYLPAKTSHTLNVPDTSGVTYLVGQKKNPS